MQVCRPTCPGTIEDFGDINSYIDSLGITGPPSANIIINNLHCQAEEHDLRLVLMKAGNIKRIEIADDAGVRFAVVEYETINDAINAMRQFKDVKFFGLSLKLTMVHATTSRPIAAPVASPVVKNVPWMCSLCGVNFTDESVCMSTRIIHFVNAGTSRIQQVMVTNSDAPQPAENANPKCTSKMAVTSPAIETQPTTTDSKDNNNDDDADDDDDDDDDSIQCTVCKMSFATQQHQMQHLRSMMHMQKILDQKVESGEISQETPELTGNLSGFGGIKNSGSFSNLAPNKPTPPQRNSSMATPTQKPPVADQSSPVTKSNISKEIRQSESVITERISGTGWTMSSNLAAFIQERRKARGMHEAEPELVEKNAESCNLNREVAEDIDNMGGVPSASSHNTYGRGKGVCFGMGHGNTKWENPSFASGSSDTVAWGRECALGQEKGDETNVFHGRGRGIGFQSCESNASKETNSKLHEEDLEEDNRKKCTLCNVEFSNEQDYLRHTRGMSHMQNIINIKKEEGELPEEQNTDPDWRQRVEVLDDHRYPTLNIEDVQARSLKPSDVGKKLFPQKFSCELCNVSCTSQANLNSHLLGSKHLKMLEHGEKGELEWVKVDEKGPSVDIIGKDPHLKAFLDTTPESIIGLEYITEYWKSDPPNYAISYVCNLCKCKCDTNTIKNHLTGTKHRSTYLKLHHPDMMHQAKVMAENKADLSIRLDFYCRQVVKFEGVKTMKIVLDRSHFQHSMDAILVKTKKVVENTRSSSIDINALPEIRKRKIDGSIHVGTWRPPFKPPGPFRPPTPYHRPPLFYSTPPGVCGRPPRPHCRPPTPYLAHNKLPPDYERPADFDREIYSPRVHMGDFHDSMSRQSATARRDMTDEEKPSDGHFEKNEMYEILKKREALLKRSQNEQTFIFSDRNSEAPQWAPGRGVEEFDYGHARGLGKAGGRVKYFPPHVTSSSESD